MKLRRFVTRLLGVVWLLVLLTLPVFGSTLELSEAQAEITIAGQTTKQAVKLPYHWDRLHAGLAGSATFYIPFEMDHQPDEPFSLYVPRLGNAYEIWLNGSLLQRNGDLENDNGADFAKVPRHLTVPARLLHTSNLLQVKIRADIGRRGGLSPSMLGPTDEIYPIYMNDYRKRSMGSFVVVIMSALLVFVTIALWVTQVNIEGLGGNRHVALYLLAGLGELFWIIRVSDVLIDQPPLAWPWWGGLMVATTAAWMATLILFCVEVALWGQLVVVARLRQWLAFLFVASFGAAYVALALGYPMVLTIFYAIVLSTAFVFACWFVWHAAHGALSHRLIAAVVVINTAVGIRDWWVFRFGSEYGGNTFMRYSVILFGLMFSYIVVIRFRQATQDAQDQVTKLHTHVAQREQELNLSYQRLEILARDQERMTERTRILRDMHDGTCMTAWVPTSVLRYGSWRAGVRHRMN